MQPENGLPGPITKFIHFNPKKATADIDMEGLWKRAVLCMEACQDLRDEVLKAGIVEDGVEMLIDNQTKNVSYDQEHNRALYKGDYIWEGGTD